MLLQYGFGYKAHYYNAIRDKELDVDIKFVKERLEDLKSLPESNGCTILWDKMNKKS